MTGGAAGERAVSPVVGAVLMVGIVVAIAAVTAFLVFGVADSGDAAPTARLHGEPADGPHSHHLVHGGGDSLQGDRLDLRGASPASSLDGETLTTGEELSVYPTAEVVDVVWHGDQGHSYVLAEIDVEDPLPPPDEGCDWVAAETNGHVDGITVDGTVVDCTVETDDQVTVRNGGVVVGETVSDSKELDADDATIAGSVTVEAVLNVQNGSIGGDATSKSEDVKLGDASVGGSVDARKVAEVADGSVVEGDVESATADAKVLESTVEGSVTADDVVKLDDATVHGDVYADPGDFDCTDATIGGEDCSSYAPKDPADW